VRCLPGRLRCVVRLNRLDAELESTSLPARWVACRRCYLAAVVYHAARGLPSRLVYLTARIAGVPGREALHGAELLQAHLEFSDVRVGGVGGVVAHAAHQVDDRVLAR
jgi:hypothetical protein